MPPVRKPQAHGRRPIMKAAGTVATLPQYDELMLKEQKLPTVSTRPTSSIVRTVE